MTEDDRPREDWELEWENYFDDLDHAVETMIKLAHKAEAEGLHELDARLVLAAADIEIHCKRCKDFINMRILELQTNLYKQNPLLKMLLEANDASDVSPFSSPVEPRHKRSQ